MYYSYTAVAQINYNVVKQISIFRETTHQIHPF